MNERGNDVARLVALLCVLAGIKFEVEMKRHRVDEVGTTNHALVLVVGFETHANVEFAVVGDLIHHTGMPDEPRFFGTCCNTKIAILDN